MAPLAGTGSRLRVVSLRSHRGGEGLVGGADAMVPGQLAVPVAVGCRERRLAKHLLVGLDFRADRGLRRFDRSGSASAVIGPIEATRILARIGIVLGMLAAAQAEPTPNHLTIASEGARPPYNYLEGDTLAGFEIDLGHELCRRMALSCSFVTQDWDSMIPGLLAHRYDAIMAAMEINPIRKARIAFSIPYVRMPSAFLTRKDDRFAATPEGLAGKTIGLEGGGTHQTFLEKMFPHSRLHEYGSLTDAILDLEAGRVDAAIGDKDAVVAFMETRGDAACCRILADVPRDPAFFGAGIGVGLRKDDAALKAAFDKALAAVIEDGTFARIEARYFDFKIN